MSNQSGINTRQVHFQKGLARACRVVNVEIVRRGNTGKFVVLPKRVRRSAPNRRTHHRLAEPLPAPEQGLGMPEPKRHRLPPLGVGSTDTAKDLPFINMILDRLSHHLRLYRPFQVIPLKAQRFSLPHAGQQRDIVKLINRVFKAQPLHR